MQLFRRDGASPLRVPVFEQQLRDYLLLLRSSLMSTIYSVMTTVERV